jgi:hypothetical protein
MAALPLKTPTAGARRRVDVPSHTKQRAKSVMENHFPVDHISRGPILPNGKRMRVAILAEHSEAQKPGKESNYVVMARQLKKMGYEVIELDAADYQVMDNERRPMRWKNARIVPSKKSGKRKQAPEYRMVVQDNETGSLESDAFDALIVTDIPVERRYDKLFTKGGFAGVPTIAAYAPFAPLMANKESMSAFFKRHGLNVSKGYVLDRDASLQEVERVWDELSASTGAVFVKPNVDGTLAQGVGLIDNFTEFLEHIRGSEKPVMVEQDDSRRLTNPSFIPEGYDANNTFFDWRVEAIRFKTRDGWSEPQISYSVMRVRQGKGATNIALGNVAVQVRPEDIPKSVKDAAIKALNAFNTNQREELQCDHAGFDIRGPEPGGKGPAVIGEANRHPDWLGDDTNLDNVVSLIHATAEKAWLSNDEWSELDDEAFAKEVEKFNNRPDLDAELAGLLTLQHI